MNIETMTDRELDALVREKLFQNSTWPAALYSVGIREAFEVVEAMRERVAFRIESLFDDKEWWVGTCNTDGKEFGIQGDAVPRLICIAALRALDA